MYCLCSGVRIEGQEFFVGDHCHLRGGQGRDDEYTCEIEQLHEDVNGEMIAKVRWFYWPAELHTKKRFKKLPSFSATKEVVLSDEYGLIDVNTISKQCHVNLLHVSTKVPDKAPKRTLYCRWMITKGSKEILPALFSTPQPVRKPKEEGKDKENEASKKRKTSPNVTKTVKKKCKITSPATKKQRSQPVHGKGDKNLFQVARERYNLCPVCNCTVTMVL